MATETCWEMCFCTVTSMAYQTTRGAIRSGIKTHGSTVPPQAMQVSPQGGEGSQQHAKCLVPYSCHLQKMASQEVGWSLFPVWSKGSCLLLSPGGSLCHTVLLHGSQAPSENSWAPMLGYCMRQGLQLSCWIYAENIRSPKMWQSKVAHCKA